jgi:2-oxoglutarate ferredoxin oxidoreductase subunit delta
LARIEIDRERCKGCELCVHFCPKKCIVIEDAYNRKGYRPAKFDKPDECTGCAICARMCPDVCIEVWR